MAVRAFIDGDLATRHIRIAAKDVVFFKSVLEASEGLGAVFADRGGDLTIAAPWSRANELDQLLYDLRMELNFEPSEEMARCGE